MNTAEPIKDIYKLQELMTVYPKYSKNHTLLAYALNTGLRVSDILKANVRDSYNGYWIDREQKTGKEKTVRLSDSLTQLVRGYIEGEQLDPTLNTPLFYSQRNKTHPISRVQAHRIIAHAGDQIGIHISAHSLRKTFGYINYQNGTDLSLLMNVFNHSSVSTTLRYIGITQDEIDRVYTTTRIGI